MLNVASVRLRSVRTLNECTDKAMQERIPAYVCFWNEIERLNAFGKAWSTGQHRLWFHRVVLAHIH
jgi:hypothetical protein